jgi:ABC-type transporter Mla MlaB component
LLETSQLLSVGTACADVDEQEGQEMLKITGQRDAALGSMSLILEGRLAGPWVEELNSYWREMLVNKPNCTMIDLTGVTFIDANGKALLTRLWQQGAELRAAGCMTRCVVEEITKEDRAGSSRLSRNGEREGG